MLVEGRLLILAVLGVVVFGGCGGAAKPPATPQCTLDSNCKDPLKCVQGYCVTACAESRDCPSGERCITTDIGNTCQPPEKKTCGANSDCDPLFCAIDLVCRNQCTTNHDCPGGDLPNGQICTASKRCIDPVLDSKSYDPLTNDFRASGDAATGAADAGASGDAAGDQNGATDGGTTDLPPPSCAPGLSGFHPSNLPVPLPTFASYATISQTTASCTFDTDTMSSMNCLTTDDKTLLHATVITLADRRELLVVYVESYILPAAKLLYISGMRPLIIAANSDIQIDGTIVAAYEATSHWYAGGAPGTTTPVRGGICPIASASGGGGPGGAAAALLLGAGGGGFCGMGGQGSAGLDGGTGSNGGSPYGTPELVPLVGGSSGGSTDQTSFTIHGGGAIELVAGGSVTIGSTGIVNMGGGGTSSTHGLGGGSGGAILLEAPTVAVSGVLTANGASGADEWGGGVDGPATSLPAAGARGLAGDGSAGVNLNGKDAVLMTTATAATGPAGGGGGAGRIRLNAKCGGTGLLAVGSSALISPDVTTTCYSKGTLQ